MRVIQGDRRGKETARLAVFGVVLDGVVDDDDGVSIFPTWLLYLMSSDLSAVKIALYMKWLYVQQSRV